MPEYLARLDSISPEKLRTTNLFISLFVLLPHIAAYFIAKPGEITGGPLFRVSMAALDVLAVFVLVGCLLTYKHSGKIQSVLKAQSLVLSVIVVPLLAWGLGIAFIGIPEGNFAFNPVLFAFLCAYPIYLLRRFVFAHRLSASWYLNYAHVIVATVAIVIGVAIFTGIFARGF